MEVAAKVREGTEGHRVLLDHSKIMDFLCRSNMNHKKKIAQLPLKMTILAMRKWNGV